MEREFRPFYGFVFVLSSAKPPPVPAPGKALERAARPKPPRSAWPSAWGWSRRDLVACFVRPPTARENRRRPVAYVSVRGHSTVVVPGCQPSIPVVRDRLSPSFFAILPIPPRAPNADRGPLTSANDAPGATPQGRSVEAVRGRETASYGHLRARGHPRSWVGPPNRHGVARVRPTDDPSQARPQPAPRARMTGADRCQPYDRQAEHTPPPRTTATAPTSQPPGPTARPIRPAQRPANVQRTRHPSDSQAAPPTDPTPWERPPEPPPQTTQRYENVTNQPRKHHKLQTPAETRNRPDNNDLRNVHQSGRTSGAEVAFPTAKGGGV